jgi:hypothetical protein
MLSVNRFDRVWISILPARQAGDLPRTAGTVEPEFLVPGMVTDHRIVDRTVTTRGGTRHIQNAVVVASYHEIAGRDPFYKMQAQGIIGLSPRSVYVPNVDGPVDDPGKPSEEWWNELNDRIDASQVALVAPPSADLIAAAEAQYAAKRELQPA